MSMCSGKINTILSKLASSEAVIGVDNEIVESLIPELEGASIDAHTLVLCSRCDAQGVMDRPGRVELDPGQGRFGLRGAGGGAPGGERPGDAGVCGSLVRFAGASRGVPQEREGAGVRQYARVASSPGDCSIRDLDFEESAANDLETLVLSSGRGEAR